jgi:hypothetical protein
MWKSAGRAPFWRVLPWHLPYNWGKKHGKTSVRVEKPQSGYPKKNPSQTLMTLNFLESFSKNTQTSHFKKNPSGGSRVVVPCGQTDGRNSRFSQFCERAPKNGNLFLPTVHM